MHWKNFSFTSPAPNVSRRKKAIYLLVIVGLCTGIILAVLFHRKTEGMNFVDQENKISLLEEQNRELVKRNSLLEEQLLQLQQSKESQPEKPVAAKAVLSAEQEKQLNQLAEDLQKTLAGMTSAETFEVMRNDGTIVLRISQDVLMKNESTYLHPKGREIVDKIMALINKDLKESFIDIESHTDLQSMPNSFQGRFDSNWEVSAGRASILASYLEKTLGMSPSRISATAFGGSRPLVNEKTSAADAKNRRIEITVSVLTDKK